MAETVKSGRWHDPTVWDTNEVPEIGVKAVVKHLIVADEDVAAGDGTDEALVLHKPLICLENLSVVGKIKGEGSECGLVFISEGRWVLYASSGIEIPPISHQTLMDLWETEFGTAMPQGLIIPIGGSIDGEFYFSPNYHDIITPLMPQIKGLDGVLTVTHNPLNPATSIKVLLSPITRDGLITPDKLLSTLNILEGYERTVSDTNPAFTINPTLTAPISLMVFAWMKETMGDRVIAVEETNETLVVKIKGSVDPTETVRAITVATNTIAVIEPVLEKLGYNQTLTFSVV